MYEYVSRSIVQGFKHMIVHDSNINYESLSDDFVDPCPERWGETSDFWIVCGLMQKVALLIFGTLNREYLSEWGSPHRKVHHFWFFIDFNIQMYEKNFNAKSAVVPLINPLL